MLLLGYIYDSLGSDALPSTMRLQKLTFAGCHAGLVVTGSLFISLKSSSTEPAVDLTIRITSALPDVARQVCEIAESTLDTRF